jgi:hypothetical protein
MFGVVSRYIVAARHPFQKRVSGCIQSMSFCHRNHFFIFRNEQAQSTTLGPKLMFGVVSRNFVAARHPFRKGKFGSIPLKDHHFGSIPLLSHLHVGPHESMTCGVHGIYLKFGSFNGIDPIVPFENGCWGCIQSMSFRHRNHFFVFRNEHAQSTTLGPKLMFGVVSCYIIAARHQFRKRVSWCIQSTSFCHQNHFFVFRNEHAQSTTLGPKLMFGVVSRNFIAARHPFRKRVSGCIQSMSFRHRNHFFVFATNMPNPLLWVQNSCLVWFRAISLPHVTHSENGCRGAYKERVFATGTISSFFTTNMPNPLL